MTPVRDITHHFQGYFLPPSRTAAGCQPAHIPSHTTWWRCYSGSWKPPSFSADTGTTSPSLAQRLPWALIHIHNPEMLDRPHAPAFLRCGPPLARKRFHSCQPNHLLDMNRSPSQQGRRSGQRGVRSMRGAGEPRLHAASHHKSLCHDPAEQAHSPA